MSASDLPGDQRGEQHQPGAAAQIQARDEPEEEMSQRAGSTQRSESELLISKLKVTLKLLNSNVRLCVSISNLFAPVNSLNCLTLYEKRLKLELCAELKS